MDAMHRDARASRKARKVRKSHWPVCGRKLKSVAGANAHRDAVGH